MKEKILAFLKTKLSGVPNAILEGAASQLATTITEESQIETVCNAGLIATLQFSSQYAQQEGDRRATSATQTAVQTYEQKFGLKDGKPVSQEPNQPVDPNNIQAVVQQAVQSAITPLQDKLKEYDTKENVAVWKKSAMDKVKDKFKDNTLPIPDVYYNTLNITKAEDVDTEVTRLSGEIEKYHQSLVDSKVITAPPVGSGGAAGQLKDSIKNWAESTNPKQD